MSEPILYIDDVLATGHDRLIESGLPFREKMPGDLADDNSISDALRDTKIVLMDYGLHDDDASSGAPLDGLELLERFRATIRRHHDQGTDVPLLNIYTNQIARLAEQHDDCPVVPYMLARRANVDWVFDKMPPADSEYAFGAQLRDMLSVFDLDVGMSDRDVEQQLASFLELPQEPDWSELALEQLLDARPPVKKDISPPGVRVRLMRWLLQVALPFPGCFVDLHSVAVRLRIPPKDLCDALSINRSSDLAAFLDQARYRGPLACFFPTRFWKAGIDYVVWKMTEGRSPANPTVRNTIATAIGEEHPLLDIADPVLVVSPETFVLTGDVAPIDEAVQVQTELWPPTVEPPWVRIADIAKDRKLRAMVVSKDRDRIGEAGA
jgi:hypothetical protein